MRTPSEDLISSYLAIVQEILEKAAALLKSLSIYK
jgi:hypothetical protein